MTASASTAGLFVIAAPSGAGKTSLVKKLVTRSPDLCFPISYTTRTKRNTEVGGVDYLFVDKNEFETLREQGKLLEFATVFDNLYGTSRALVEQHIHEGHQVVLEIDWQGAQQVRDAMPDCTTIFILPPSLPELERRLRDRRTDSEAVIDRRLRDARSDMSHWGEFDFVVINDDFDKAVTDLEAILADRGKAQATGNEALRAAVTEIVD